MKTTLKNKKIIIILLLTVFSLLMQVNALTTNGTEKNFDFVISSGKSDNISSSNYALTMVVGDTSATIQSNNYKLRLGFLKIAPLLNGESCQTNSECLGGFCCSNVCQSTSCPVEVATTAAGGGAAAAAGGGGGALPIKVPEKDFNLSKNTIKAKLVLAEEKGETIIISNTGKTNLDFSLIIDGEIKEFLNLPENSFTLQAGESKTISLEFVGKRVGSFTGSIVVKGSDIEKNIAVSLEIESKISLFDVKIDIPTAYKTVKPGGELKSQITLLSLGPPQKFDVTINYIIKDLKGNLVLQETETLGVEGQLSFMKSFQLPKSLEPGVYVVSVEVIYSNSFAVSSEFFEVKEPEIEKLEVERGITTIIYSILIILILSSLTALIYLIPKYRLMHIEGLYENFWVLLEEINSKIKVRQYDAAFKLYYQLYLAYTRLLKYSIKPKIKIGMYKNIKQVYDKLNKIKEDDYKQ